MFQRRLLSRENNPLSIEVECGLHSERLDCETRYWPVDSHNLQCRILIYSFSVRKASGPSFSGPPYNHRDKNNSRAILRNETWLREKTAQRSERKIPDLLSAYSEMEETKQLEQKPNMRAPRWPADTGLPTPPIFIILSVGDHGKCQSERAMKARKEQTNLSVAFSLLFGKGCSQKGGGVQANVSFDLKLER